MQNRALLSFTGALTLGLFVVFALHYGYFMYREISCAISELLSPYTVNYFLAIGITSALYLLREKQANNLGFLFMGSSFIKFAVFFIFFYPKYSSDGDVSQLEFGLFFIPYAISLTIETTFLVRILNRM